jgi:hypothetical protein
MTWIHIGLLGSIFVCGFFCGMIAQEIRHQRAENREALKECNRIRNNK